MRKPLDEGYFLSSSGAGPGSEPEAGGSPDRSSSPRSQEKSEKEGRSPGFVSGEDVASEAEEGVAAPGDDDGASQ
jgi:hypothetical protein